MKLTKLTFIGSWMVASAVVALMSGCYSSMNPQDQLYPVTPEQGEEAALSYTVRNADNENLSAYLNRDIAVRVGEEVRTYRIMDEQNLLAGNPFRWQIPDNVLTEVTAWYPANGGEWQDEVKVRPTQNIRADYEASNLMHAYAPQLSPDAATLELKHRTAKLVCRLAASQTAATRATSIEGAVINLLNVKGVTEGTTVTMSTDFKAFIAPQTFEAGKEFVEVKLADGKALTYVMESNFTPQEGLMYNMDAILEEVVEPDEPDEPDNPDEPGEPTAIRLIIHEGVRWEGDKVDLAGDASTGNADDTNAGWDGSSDSTDGSSNNGNADGTNGSWGGSNESTDGSSNSGNADNTNGNWDGSNESTDGTTNNATPGDGTNGNWEGSNEPTDGTTNNATPGNGTNGNWEGSNEPTDGTTNNATPSNGTNGNWEGSNESTGGTTNNATPGNGTNGNWEGSNESTNGTTNNGNADDTNASWSGTEENVTGSKENETTTTS